MTELVRFTVTLDHVDQWYAIMRECRAWFGTNWRAQPKIRRRFSRVVGNRVDAWFEVPDAKFVSWVALKLAVPVQSQVDLAWDHYSDLPAPAAYAVDSESEPPVNTLSCS